MSSYSMRTKQPSLLQDVIRNLSVSSDNSSRDNQRRKLQDDLKLTSERMESLVRDHQENLHGTLETFVGIDAKICESQEKVRQLKASLKECKTLLHCKRDELRRLWLEDVKYKQMIKILESIENVREVPEQIKKYRSSKHYLHATELVFNTVAKLEGELSRVEALKDLRLELTQLKLNFHHELIDELHRQLYLRAAMSPTRPSPFDAVSGQSPAPAKRLSTVSRTSATRHSRSASRTMAMEKELSSVRSPPPIREEVDEVTEDLDVESPEENSQHFMAVLVESLSTLGCVVTAVEALRQRMDREFLLVVERASVHVTRVAQEETSVLSQRARRGNRPELLVRLLHYCFERFRNIVAAHSSLLVQLNRARRTFKGSYKLYQTEDVWKAIQHVLQTVMEMYLSVEEDVMSPTTINTYTPFMAASEVQGFFAPKRKSHRAGKKPFFKFDSSRHAISVSTYMREQRDLELAEGQEVGGSSQGQAFPEEQLSMTQHMVCKPSVKNITVMFGPVREFVLEIEEALHLPANEHCQLYLYLHEFVEEKFLDSLRFELVDRLSSAAKSESSKAVASDQRAMKLAGSKQFVLNSVITVWSIVEELCQLMRDLPKYSAHFLLLLCDILKSYRDSCGVIYKDLTQAIQDSSASRAGEKMVAQETVISSKWARDKDINRMIRSLPSWAKLYEAGRATLAEQDDEGMSIHKKESDNLVANLGEETFRPHSVILNTERLRLLAIIHESMDWFSGKLKALVMDLANTSASVKQVADFSDGAAISTINDEDREERSTLDFVEQSQHLSKIQFDFQTLAETSIIMLHLEVRGHCFYYLKPTLTKTSYEMETSDVDVPVRQLAVDLKDIETVMVAVLSQEKYHYLFEGLGHLVATIFISSVQHTSKINVNGVKKICRSINSLQSCLSKITLIREKDLDRARQYFEMLYLNDEEILHQISELGKKFSEQEYASALRLLAHSSQPFNEARLQHRLRQLRDLFSGDAV